MRVNVSNEPSRSLGERVNVSNEPSRSPGERVNVSNVPREATQGGRLPTYHGTRQGTHHGIYASPTPPGYTTPASRPTPVPSTASRDVPLPR